MSRVLCAVVVAGLLSACGGDSSPTVAPSPTPAPAPAPTPTPAPTPAPVPAPPPATVAQIGGTWIGVIDYTDNGRAGTCLRTRTALQQTDRTITGDWLVTFPSDNRITGDITGTLQGVGSETTFSGTVTWKTEIGTGTGACVGQSSFTGRATSSQLEWTAPDVQFRNCTDPGFRSLTWAMAPVTPRLTCN